jgi:hypothetical protein
MPPKLGSLGPYSNKQHSCCDHSAWHSLPHSLPHHLPALLSAGPALVPNGVYNVFGSCQVVNSNTPMYCPPDGDSTKAESQVYVERTDGGSGLIKPGDTLLWKSLSTGKYCRSVDDPVSIMCDLDVPTPKSVITYTGALETSGHSNTGANPRGCSHAAAAPCWHSHHSIGGLY